MRVSLPQLAAALALPLLPFSVQAFSDGPLPGHTGAPTEFQGRNCTACHITFRPANSDPSGRIRIEAAKYKPGVRQIIRVFVEHPAAVRWGFQLTARLASDETKPAGTFTANSQVRVQCGQGEQEGNCRGAVEYASHRAVSTQRGALGVASWEIEWTPPAIDVGQVVFYAAGNATNGNNTNIGDWVYTTTTRIRSADETCALTERPRISAVKNGASFLEGPVALNTFISVEGSGFQAAGRTITADQFDFVDSKFPSSLGCIAVEIDGRRAPLVYAQANQINAQVPSTTAIGPVQVRVIANPGLPNELRSDPVNLQLAQQAPAFFRFLPTPCIAAVFTNGEFAGDPSLLPFTKAAKQGDILTLFATGLGVTNPFYQAGEITTVVAPTTAPVQIEWNERAMNQADILYAGLANGFISGLYQINIRVPTIARGNAHNAVRLRVGNVLSPEGTTFFIAAP